MNDDSAQLLGKPYNARLPAPSGWIKADIQFGLN